MTQAEYDRILIEAFYKAGDAHAWRLLNGYNLEDLEALKLKRLPNQLHLNKRIATFVCGNIPKLGNFLWNHDIKKIDQIVRVLGRTKIDTNLHAVAPMKGFKRMMRKECDRFHKQQVMALKIGDINSKASGHEWHTVK